MEYLQNVNLFLGQYGYEFNLTIALISVAVIASLGITVAVVLDKTKKKTIETPANNNVDIDALILKSEAHDAQLAEESAQDQEIFNEAFGGIITSIKNDVENDSTPKNEGSQELWVNWMLNIGGKARLKQSEFVVSAPWGTKTAKRELEAQINDKCKEISTEVEFSWMVVNVQPLKA